MELWANGEGLVGAGCSVCGGMFRETCVFVQIRLCSMPEIVSLSQVHLLNSGKTWVVVLPERWLLVLAA